MFSAGVFVSWGGIALGVGGSMLAALAAGALPAWQATRVSPLEAMTPGRERRPGSRVPLAAAAVGLVLVCIDPLLFHGPTNRDRRAGSARPTPTSAATNVKFVLPLLPRAARASCSGSSCSPRWWSRRSRAAAGPAVARAFGLNAALLRQQLSTGLWRAAGTAAALMVGLAVLVVMQVQGYSALTGWKLPTKFPDLFIVATAGTSADPTTGDPAAAQTRPATGPGTQPAPAAAKPTLLSTAFGLFGSPTFGRLPAGRHAAGHPARQVARPVRARRLRVRLRRARRRRGPAQGRRRDRPRQGAREASPASAATRSCRSPSPPRSSATG